MNPVLNTIFKQRTVKDAQGKPLNVFPTSISEGEGRALYNIIRRTGAQKTLEIGLAYAISSLFICQAHVDNRGSGSAADAAQCHTALDPYQTIYWKSVGLLNLERAGFEPMVRFYELPSHQILPDLVENGEHFDFIFIDGAHLFDYVLLDFLYADHLVALGGYLMFHDLRMPAIRKLLAFILRNYAGYQIVTEFNDHATPPWRKLTRLAMNFLQSPLDLYAWSLPITQKQLDLFERNYCVLRKVDDDRRPWNHYQAF